MICFLSTNKPVVALGILPKEETVPKTWLHHFLAISEGGSTEKCQSVGGGRQHIKNMFDTDKSQSLIKRSQKGRNQTCVIWKGKGKIKQIKLEA